MNNLTLVSDADNSAIATWLEGRLRASLQDSEGTISICLPGGSTPFPILEQLKENSLDWSRIEVWPGDDRIVPEDHEASNTGKIRALLEPAGAAVRILTEDAQPPKFALVWLGMGADGHIASLFPNIDPQPDDVQSVRRLTPDPLPPEAPFDRITLTIPALLNSEALMFVIRGEEKRAVFDAAVAGQHDLPVARLLQKVDQPIQCFV